MYDVIPLAVHLTEISRLCRINACSIASEGEGRGAEGGKRGKIHYYPSVYLFYSLCMICSPQTLHYSVIKVIGLPLRILFSGVR